MKDICYTVTIPDKNWVIVSTTNISTALDTIKDCENDIEQTDYIVLYRFCNGKHLTLICFDRNGTINTEHTESVLCPSASFTKEEIYLVKELANELNVK